MTIEKPTDLCKLVEVDQIPLSLTQIPQWICWRLKDTKKVPYGDKQCSRQVDCTDKKNWKSFDNAVSDYLEYGCSGIGFVLNGSGIIGIDLDDCVTGGQPSPASLAILNQMGADYVEFSPSGTGLRSFGYGTLKWPYRNTISGVKVELYADARFLTVTGWRFCGVTVAQLGDLPNFFAAYPLASNSSISSISSNSSVSSVSSVASVSSVNSEAISRFEIPHSLIPTGCGQRNHHVFRLARHLKTQFTGVNALELKPIVQKWHQLALPFIATKQFDETWLDFCYAFDKVKYTNSDAWRLVMENLPELPRGMLGVGQFGAPGDRLLQICVGLSKLLGDEPFFLASRQCGNSLGISHQAASKLIHALVVISALIKIEPATKRKAARFKLPKLSEPFF